MTWTRRSWGVAAAASAALLVLLAIGALVVARSTGAGRETYVIDVDVPAPPPGAGVPVAVEGLTQSFVPHCEGDAVLVLPGVDGSIRGVDLEAGGGTKMGLTSLTADRVAPLGERSPPKPIAPDAYLYEVPAGSLSADEPATWQLHGTGTTLAYGGDVYPSGDRIGAVKPDDLAFTYLCREDGSATSIGARVARTYAANRRGWALPLLVIAATGVVALFGLVVAGIAGDESRPVPPIDRDDFTVS